MSADYHAAGTAHAETQLLGEQLQIERKIFSFALKENSRGRFLKITEDVGGRRDSIIIPSTGLEQVCNIIERAIRLDKDGVSAPSDNG